MGKITGRIDYVESGAYVGWVEGNVECDVIEVHLSNGKTVRIMSGTVEIISDANTSAGVWINTNRM